MSVGQLLEREIQDLPVDVFDLTGQGYVVESLTAGHDLSDLTEATGRLGDICCCPCFCCLSASA